VSCLVNDDAINTALINAMNNMQTSSKQVKTSTSRSLDDVALKKHKCQVLAKYSEVSDEEFDYDNQSGTSANGLFHNTNAQEIEDRERKAREGQHEVGSIVGTSSIDIVIDMFSRHTRNNKRRTKSMLPIKSKKTKNERRKLNNARKNKNDDVSPTVVVVCARVFVLFDLC
jgi:hypothetical protein